MTRKERVLACCEHKPVDRVPVYHASISSRMASVLLGRTAHVGGAIQRWHEALALWKGEDAHKEFLERTKQDTIDVAKALDVDLVRVAWWRLTKKPTKRIDEHTFFYGDPDGRWEVMRFDPDTELYQTIEQSPRPIPTEADLEPAVIRMEKAAENHHPTPDSFPDIQMGLAAFDHERAVPGTGVGVGILREEIWLEAMVTHPDLVGRWLDAQAEMDIHNIVAQSKLDVQVMLGGGDMASYKGPMYSPRAFREIILPRLKRVVDACHAHGKYYFFASDGDLWPIADDLFPSVDGYYEIDRRAGMDLAKLRERYPHLTCIGNISSHTLHLGTKEEVIEETLSCLEAAKKYGSIIVGVSNLIMPQTPEVNLHAMLDTLRENR